MQPNIEYIYFNYSCVKIKHTYLLLLPRRLPTHQWVMLKFFWLSLTLNSAICWWIAFFFLGAQQDTTVLLSTVFFAAEITVFPRSWKPLDFWPASWVHTRASCDNVIIMSATVSFLPHLLCHVQFLLFFHVFFFYLFFFSGKRRFPFSCRYLLLPGKRSLATGASQNLKLNFTTTIVISTSFRVQFGVAVLLLTEH